MIVVGRRPDPSQIDLKTDTLKTETIGPTKDRKIRIKARLWSNIAHDPRIGKVGREDNTPP